MSEMTKLLLILIAKWGHFVLFKGPFQSSDVALRLRLELGSGQRSALGFGGSFGMARELGNLLRLSPDKARDRRLCVYLSQVLQVIKGLPVTGRLKLEASNSHLNPCCAPAAQGDYPVTSPR